MKRWWVAFALVVLACVPIFLARSSSPFLLTDSDTAYLLLKVRERQDPLRWFTGDWPLGNHFYRPISTLFFEMDNALHGTNAAGYGLTNVLLAIACVLVLFWLLRELTDHLVVTTASTLLYAFWHIGWQMWLITVVQLAVWAIMIVGVVRHGRQVRIWLPAVLVTIYLASELAPLGNVEGGIIAWLPGRTASVMTLFVLLSLACYARYERLGSKRVKPEPTPLDPPATKGTQVVTRAPKRMWLWPPVSVVCLLLALGSYEQAVMTPALLLAVAVTMKCLGYRVRWGWQGAFWLCLIGYLVLRQILVPSDASKYQMQAFRTGPGVWLDLGTYIFPGLTSMPAMFMDLSLGPIVLLFVKTWRDVIFLASNVVAAVQARRHWQLALAGWGMSVLAFLPMAWLKRFEHYHYLPMAFRALFAVVLAWIALELFVIAASPRARQAPLRPSPAPGSLPHR